MPGCWLFFLVTGKLVSEREGLEYKAIYY